MMSNLLSVTVFAPFGSEAYFSSDEEGSNRITGAPDGDTVYLQIIVKPSETSFVRAVVDSDVGGNTSTTILPGEDITPEESVHWTVSYVMSSYISVEVKIENERAEESTGTHS